MSDKPRMKSKRLVLTSAALACLAIAQPALSADWQFVTKGGGVNVNIDVTSLRDRPPVAINRPFPVKQAWIMFLFSSTKDRWDKQEVRLTSVNCDDETSLVLSSTEYLPNNVVGKTTTIDDYYFNYQPSPPDTLGSAVIKFMCNT